jgi:hypothetical protein
MLLSLTAGTVLGAIAGAALAGAAVPTLLQSI